MIPVGMPDIGEEEIEAVSGVIRSGMLAQGPKTAEFEEKFARYCGTDHAIAVNNGTAALHATLVSLGIGPGAEVIVPSFTFFATASSVCMAGARPVFADVEYETFNISVESVQELLTQRTRAIIGVDLFGQPFEVSSLREICGERGIPLIEDAAQAHGAEFQGIKTGNLTTAGCFSFYPTKNMTTGEGGMVTTNDGDLAKRIRVIINHGQPEKYVHTCLGYNFRMTDIGAAIGLVQLWKLDAFNAKRQDTASYFDDHLTGGGIETPVIAPGRTHVYHQYVIRVTDECHLTRDELAVALRDKSIGTAVHYPVPLHRQPFFEECAKMSSCPVADRLANEVLSLPVHPRVTEGEREYICRFINEVT